MDQKTINTLEFPKVLEKLEAYAAFSASAELARALSPSANLEGALIMQARTSEARRLLSIQSEIGVGGATDIRPQVYLAAHGGVETRSSPLRVPGGWRSDPRSPSPGHCPQR